METCPQSSSICTGKTDARLPSAWDQNGRRARTEGMRSLLSAALGVLLLSTLISPARAARPAVAQEEIDHLLAFVEKSDVRFIRNGSEHSAKESADHLRDKLGRAGDRVKTAEDFIVGIASKSYLSGKSYLVKTPDGKERPTGLWLSEELTRYRADKGRAGGKS